MVQMAFNVINTAWNNDNENNITLLAKKEKEVWWYGLLLISVINLVFMNGTQK